MNSTRLLPPLLRKTAALLALFTVMVASTATAQDIYVSQTEGDDVSYNGQAPQASGGQNGPFKTLGKALEEASAGDIIAIDLGGSGYDSGSDTLKMDLSFETYNVEGGSSAVITNGFKVSGDANVTIGNGGPGTFELQDGGTTPAALNVQSGTVAVSDEDVMIAGGATIIRGDGSIDGSLSFGGGVTVKYTGSEDVTAGAEIPNDDDLTGANDALIVDPSNDEAIALTLADEIAVNSVEVEDGSSILLDDSGGDTEYLRFPGGGSIQGTGTLENILALGGTTTVPGNIDFSGTLSLSNGGIDATGGDLSPAAEGTPLLQINVASSSTDITGSFNGDNSATDARDFDLEYIGDEITGSPRSVSVNFGAVNDLRFLAEGSVGNETIDASGATVDSVSGDIQVGSGGPLTVVFPGSDISVDGTLMVADSASLYKNSGTLTVSSPITTNGNIEDNNGGNDAKLVLNDGANVTGDGKAQLLKTEVAEDATVQIEGISQINNNVTTDAGSSLRLALSMRDPNNTPDDDSDDEPGLVTGDLSVGGDSFTLVEDAYIDGSVQTGESSFAFGDSDLTLNGGGDFLVSDDGDDDVASFSATTGSLVLENATNLGTQGQAIPNVTLNSDVTLASNATVGESFTHQSGTVSSNADTLTFMGAATIGPVQILSGSGALSLDDVDVSLMGTSSASNLTVANGVSLTAQEDSTDNDAEEFGFTALSSLTQNSGGLTLNDDTPTNSVLLKTSGGYDFQSGSVDGSGFLEITGGGISAAADLPVSNLSINNGSGVTVTEEDGDVTLTIGDILALKDGEFNVDTADLSVADDATIIRWAGSLAFDDSDGGGSIALGNDLTVKYGTEGGTDYGTITTGDELPEALSSVVVYDDIKLNTSATVDSLLLIADPVAGNGNTSDDDDEKLTLASGAELILQGDGTVTDGINVLNTYALTYRDYSAGSVSDQEFIEGATITTLTIDDDNVIDYIEQGDRTVQNVALKNGVLDLTGDSLIVSQDLRFQGGDLDNSGSPTAIAFDGAKDAKFALGGDATQPDDLNIVLMKDDEAIVTLTGGDLDFAENDQVLYLNGGILASDESMVTLSQKQLGSGNNRQGYKIGDGVSGESYVAAPVQKHLNNDPGTDDFVGKVEYPVGDTLGNYSPLQFSFDQQTGEGTLFETDLTVDFTPMSPKGNTGLPATGPDTTSVSGTTNFYWDVTSSDGVGGANYDVEATAEGYDVPDNVNIGDLRILRRRSNDKNSPYGVVGESYDSFITSFDDDDQVPVLAAIDAKQDLGSRGGTLFTYGTPNAAPAQVTVNFEDQNSGGRTVVVDHVDLTGDGYVAIHDSTLLDGEVTGSVIGVSRYLEAGSYDDLSVSLFNVKGADFPADTTLPGDQKLIAMPHKETNGNNVYNFVSSDASEDGPYTSGGSAIIDPAMITIKRAAVTFDDQTSEDGRTVSVASTYLPNNGFVAIHDASLLGADGKPFTDDDQPLSSVIGVSDYLKAGAHENVVIELFDVPGLEVPDDTLEADQTLIAMPHVNTNGNDSYDFLTTNGNEDGPFLNAEGNAVVDLGAIDVPERLDTRGPVAAAEFAVKGNYPNPFNSATTLNLDLPKKAKVTVDVVNVLGRRVKRIEAQPVSAGAGQSLQLQGMDLPAGVYVYRVTARSGDQTWTSSGKMTVVR